MPRISEVSSNINLLAKDISAGVIGTTPSYTDNGNGTVTIGACTVLLYDNANKQGSLIQYSIPQLTNQAVNLNESGYIVVNYNSGNPVYQLLTYTQLALINESDIIPIYTVYNEDNTLVHRITWDELGQGLPNKLHARLVKTNRFARESGLQLTTSGDGNRRVLISSGVIWTGAVRHVLNAFNTGTNGHRWYFWQKTGASTWSRSVTTNGTGTFNNTQYNTEGGSLTSLTTGSPFTVNWIYRDLDTDSHAGYVLGDMSYGSLSSARASQPRNDLPPEFAVQSVLVGRVIAKLGETVAVEVAVTFPPYEIFTGNSISSTQPSFGEIYGCPLSGSEAITTSIPAQTYNPVLAGDRLISGISTGITPITKNVGSGLTLNLGASVTNGRVARVSTLTVGSGYGADGTYTNVSTTGGSGTGCTVDIIVENGKVKHVIINNGGSGYTASNTLTVTGGTATFIVSQITNGVIQSVTVNAGGTGYVQNQCVSISTGNKNAIVKLTNVVGGVVQAGGVTLLYGGSGYTGGATGQATTPISGFIATQSGTYKIDSTTSFSDSTSSAHTIKGLISIAKSTRRIRQQNGLFVRTISSTNIGSAGFSAYVDVSVGDFVYYEFENGHTAPTTLTLNAFEWVMFRI